MPDTHCVLLRNVRALASDLEQALLELCTLFISRFFLSHFSEPVLLRAYTHSSHQGVTCQGRSDSNSRSLASMPSTRVFSSVTAFLRAFSLSCQEPSLVSGGYGE